MIKQCPGCFTDKPVTDFRPNRRRKDGLQGYCRICDKNRQKAWYTRNKKSAGIRARKNTKIYLEKIHGFLGGYFQSHPCVDCGEPDILVLEFDHERDKEDCISTAVRRGWSLERIIREVSKCNVRCVNCHRKKTARQCGSWRLNYVRVSESG